MASQDRPGSKSRGGTRKRNSSETKPKTKTTGSPGVAGSSAEPGRHTEKGMPGKKERASAVAPDPRRAKTPAGQDAARRSATTAAADADHKPLHPGIDAMAILERAETEQRAAAAAKLSPPAKRLPNAAEVIAKTTARDHPNRGAGTAAQQPTLPRYEPAPWPAPKGPLPVEPAEPIGGVGPKGVPAPLVDGEVIAEVLNADLSDPFAFFGMHRDGPNGALVVRAFLPTASMGTLV